MNNESTIPILAASLFGATFAFADSGVPKTYPLKKCVVSDEGFDHGKAVKVTAPEGTDVYLCCKDCVRDFKKEPAEYAKMVRTRSPKSRPINLPRSPVITPGRCGTSETS
jgi:YHS domain-containing protein